MGTFGGLLVGRIEEALASWFLFFLEVSHTDCPLRMGAGREEAGVGLEAGGEALEHSANGSWQGP